MRKALATLLEGAIDYAGLFPPAGLDMPSAVAEYDSLRQGREAFLLNRFACPTDRLEELAARLSGPPLAVTAIGGSGDWAEAREADAAAMNRFLERCGERAEIQAYEVAAPDVERLDEHLRDLRGFDSVAVYVEIPWSGPLQESIAVLAQSEFAFAKGRTGGAYIPASEELAAFIRTAVSLDWPFKLTAGLHRLFPSERSHGLLNVLCGAALALAEDLSQRELQQVLEAPMEQWRFGEETIACKGFEADFDAIAAARDLFQSVGSCSVVEPFEELEAMGLVGG